MARISKRHFGVPLLATVSMIALFAGSGVVRAQETQDASNAALMNRIEKLETELSTLKQLLRKSEAKAEEASQKATEAASTVSQVASKVEEASSGGGGFGGGGIFNYTAGDYHFHLGGYAGTNLEVVDNGENSTFADVNFNPIFLIGYKDWLQFESELEFETSEEGEETNVELEYAQADLFLNDYMTLVIGKTLSPVGIFQERLHPKWINKSIDRPIGFDGIVEPKTEVGVQLRGGLPLGESAKVTYTFMIGNGPQIEDNGIPILEGFGEDNNDNKALSGRISFFPVPWLEIGASGMTAKVNGVEGMSGTPGNADFTIWGAHAVLTHDDLDLRFEYLNSVRDPILSAPEPTEDVALLPKEDLEAWYVQAAYKFAGLTNEPFLRNLEVVGRFSELNVNGSANFADDAQQRWSFNFNYLFAPNVIAKAGYEKRDFDNPLLGNENRFLAQFSYGF